MSKKIVCFLLALVMILGLFPTTVITANAASTWNTSEKAITEILTKPDRFQEKAYQRGGVWYIGYGTEITSDALYPDGISEDKALELLKKHLKDAVDVEINKFTKSNDLYLTQQQHDALAWLSMNEGYAWTTDANFRSVVLTGKKGTDFLTAIAQIGGAARTNDDGLKVLMNRRLAVANLYLNASYAYQKPGNYTYVVLADAKGSNTGKVVAYSTSAPVTLGKSYEAAGANFLGWFRVDEIDKEGEYDDAVIKLDASTAGKTLVPLFNTSGVKFDYEINTNSLPSRYYFSKTHSKTDIDKYKANMDEAAAGKLAGGTAFRVTNEQMVDGVKWIYGTGKNEKNETVSAWVYLGELPEDDKNTQTVVATATITAASVDIREGSTEGKFDNDIDKSHVIGTIAKDVTVNVYQIKSESTEVGNKKWGLVTYNGVTGWINLKDAKVLEVSGTNNAADGRKGKIFNAEEVNVRNEKGTVGTTVITTLKAGTEVTILKTDNVGNAQWGYVEWSGLKDGYTRGWVYMYYVNVEGLPQSTPGGTPENVKYTGVVTSNINLNVRCAPDVYAAPNGPSLPTGTKVNVYETAESRGMKWGRIGADQWVCLSYLNLTEVQAPAAGTGTTTTTSLQATVSINTLSIYKNYNSNAAKVGTLKKGDVLTVLEKNTEVTETGSRIWGRIVKDGVEGWINLAYVELKTVTAVNNGSTSTGTGAAVNSNGAAGVVANCVAVNVRTGAGTYNTQITKLRNGTAVKVYDRVTQDSAPWARITWQENGTTKEGWVCMNYVTMAAPNTTPNANGSTIAGTNSNTISATGTVNSNINLKVRSGAGLNYPDFDSLAKGTRVTIYDQVTNDNMIWGRINTASGSGWICMSYVTVDNTSFTGKGVMGTIARCAVAVNVRSAPGTGNALVGTIGVGKRVEVFETRQHGTGMWARVAQGWISMEYVILDSELAPGTALDATDPSTEPTQASEPAPTVNKDNEVKYYITGDVQVAAGQAEAVETANNGVQLKVHNDASSKSDKVGAVKNGETLNILAVKTNNAELWGRIEQYATAGWVNMSYVNYNVHGYVNIDKQPVYADPDTTSTVKGTLGVNTEYNFKKLTANGGTVYGWYEDTTGLAGWIPMGRISDERVAATYSTATNTFGTTEINGKTNAAVTAYNEAGGSKVMFNLTAGVTVYIGEIDLEHGVAWGKLRVIVDPADPSKDIFGWINLNSVTYATTGWTVATGDPGVKLDAWKTRDTSDSNNSLGKLDDGTSINICELSFDGNGNLWGKVTGNANPAVNGGYVRMDKVNATISIEWR